MGALFNKKPAEAVLIKYLRALFTCIVFCLCVSVYAADGSAGASGDSQDAVAKFKDWLAERDQQNENALNASGSATPVPQQMLPAVSSEQHAPSSNFSDNDAIQDAAFKQVVSQTMPMSPDQIKQYRGLVQETQRAAATYPGNGPPKPVSSTLVVNMAPGSTPPAVRMYQGFITSLVFVDSTGAVWPVESYDLGNSKAFNIQWDRKSNVLMVQPQQAYTFANLAVKLAGLSTPVMLTLVPGQAFVDYRVDLRINGLGPNAAQPMQAGVPDQADSALISVLDGIPPSGAVRLKVEGGIAEAWDVSGTLYVRTRFTLLSPAWLNVMSSPDGMHAYKLQSTPSVLISQYGKPVAAKIAR